MPEEDSNRSNLGNLGKLYSPAEPRLFIFTGPSGSGKTTWCIHLAKWASSHNLEVDGLISPPVYKDGKKIGIALLALRTGQSHQLAWQRTQNTNGLTTADWQFSEETLQWGNQVLAEYRSCHVFLLDEVGPLEFERGCGLTNGLAIIDHQHYHFACVVVRPAFLLQASSRWPTAKVLDLQEQHS